jgi:hypothetical protein
MLCRYKLNTGDFKIYSAPIGHSFAGLNTELVRNGPYRKIKGKSNLCQRSILSARYTIL